MRKSREETAETRARIIRKASKEFNQHGIAGTGLADVMKSAGLTHGGFYKHFHSKDELVAEAFERGLEKSFQALEHSAVEDEWNWKGIYELDAVTPRPASN